MLVSAAEKNGSTSSCGPQTVTLSAMPKSVARASTSGVQCHRRPSTVANPASPNAKSTEQQSVVIHRRQPADIDKGESVFLTNSEAQIESNRILVEVCYR